MNTILWTYNLILKNFEVDNIDTYLLFWKLAGARPEYKTTQEKTNNGTELPLRVEYCKSVSPVFGAIYVGQKNLLIKYGKIKGIVPRKSSFMNLKKIKIGKISAKNLQLRS